jgi:hypothetical protein
MPSLVNTLLRWYWAVRGLMNSRAPICGLDGALAGGLAGGQQLAPGPPGERPHRVQHGDKPKPSITRDGIHTRLIWRATNAAWTW